MSLQPNCSIALMVEKEMKQIGWLILSLIKKDDPNVLSRFIGNHTKLRNDINIKRRVVSEPSHVRDLEADQQKLVKIEGVLSLVQDIITMISNKSNDIPSNDLEVDDMSQYDLHKWYQHCMECVSWVLLNFDKIPHKMESFSSLIQGINNYLPHCTTNEQKYDLELMLMNSQLLYRFLETLSKQVMIDDAEPTFGKKQSSNPKRGSSNSKRKAKPKPKYSLTTKLYSREK